MAEGGEAIKQRVQRFTDVAQEPLEFLSPIGGYEEMPVVSLEQAVEKLVHLLPAVQSHAYIAKQKCDKPADGLSQDESASIMLYTMGWRPLNKCLYVVLNATLRSADREKLEPWLLYLRLFVSGLSRLPPVRETVYRGVKLDLSREYIKGETIVWWGFSSCTTNVSVLQSELFLGKKDTRTMFTIKCESARDIQNHSYYPSEDEMLLLAATQFQVTGCLDQGALCIIQLKETQPPFPLLHPVPLIIQSTKPSSSSVSTSSESVSTSAVENVPSSPSPVVEPSTVFPLSVVKPSTVLRSSVVEPSIVLPSSVNKPSAILRSSIVKPTIVLPSLVVKPSTILRPLVVKPPIVLPSPVVEPSIVLSSPVVKPSPVLRPPVVESSTVFRSSIVKSSIISRSLVGKPLTALPLPPKYEIGKNHH